MLCITDKGILAHTGLNECWFYAERVDDGHNMKALIRLFCEDEITGMKIGEVCVFFIKGKAFVKLLKSESWGWDLEILSQEQSKAFIDLEWVLTL